MFIFQLIAYISMTVEHCAGFLPDLAHLPAILLGRVAFPLFLFGIVQGYRHTRNRFRYFLNLLILALISEPAYYLYFHKNINVIFTLSYALGLLALSDRNLLLALALNSLTFFIPGYLFYAGSMALAMYYLAMVYQIPAVFLILILASFKVFILQPVGILAYLFICLDNQRPLRIPKILKYSYYPVHLALLCLLDLYTR